MKTPLDLQDELRRMPEWERLSEVRQFTLSLEIFQRNAQEFRALLEGATTPQAATVLWSLHNRPQLEQFQREVTRLLHNFVAAAFSLVDHARRFFGKHYKDAKSFPDYEDEVRRRFAEDPLCQFVQGLRNYFIHRKPPNIGSTMSLSQGQAARHTIHLEKGDLMDFDWNATARRFLDEAADKLDLQNVVAAYSTKVTEFYAWMFKRLEEIHADDVAAVNAKQAEVRTEMGKLIPGSLASDLMIAAQIRVQPEQFFLAFMDPTRWAQLCRQHAAPEERANALLDAVEECSPPLGDLRAKFVQLFKTYYARATR